MQGIHLFHLKDYEKREEGRLHATEKSTSVYFIKKEDLVNKCLFLSKHTQQAA